MADADAPATADAVAAPPSPCVVTAHERFVAAHTSTGTSLDKLGYYWDQSDTDVRISFDVCASSDDNIFGDFSPRACVLTAAVGERRYFFEIKRTYMPIDPSWCIARRNKKKQLMLRLRKQKAGIEWPSLRCMDGELIL